MARVQGAFPCSKCNRAPGEKHLATGKRPTMAALERMVENGVAKATDGCRVEPDGRCAHDHASWLLVLGFI